MKQHSGSLRVGQTGIYTISVTNVGDGPTNGSIIVTDTLPVGFAFVSNTGGGFLCSAAGQVTTCVSSIILQPKAVTFLTLTVRVSNQAQEAVINRAVVATAGDLNRSNDSASDATNVVGGLPNSNAPTPTITPTRTGSGGGSSGVGTATPTMARTLTPGVATRTATATAPAAPTATHPPVVGPCTGARSLKLIAYKKDPSSFQLQMSATSCPPPPGCYLPPNNGSVIQAPIDIVVTDSAGVDLFTSIPGVPLTQGRGCPGGVDSFCRTQSAANHADRMVFAYGKDGITTLRAKLHVNLTPPVFPTLIAPLTLVVTDASGYRAEVTYSRCVDRVSTTSTTIQCN